MRPAKPWHLSLLIIVVAIGLLITTVQLILFDQYRRSSISSFEGTLISLKQEEAESFAKLINQDFDSFYRQMYAFFSSSVHNRLALAIDDESTGSRYLQDIQYVWSEINARQLDLGFVRSIELYFPNRSKTVTQNSVHSSTEAELKNLALILSRGQRVVLENGVLYLCVTQRYSESNADADSGTIALGRATVSDLQMYLRLYSSDKPGSNLTLLFSDGETLRPLAASERIENMQPVVDCLSAAQRTPSSHVRAFIGDRECLLNWTQIGSSPLSLCEITPWEACSGEVLAYQSSITQYQILALILSTVLMISLYLVLSQPLLKLSKALKAMEDQRLETRLGYTWVTEYQYAYCQFNQMSDKIQDLVNREYTMRFLSMRAELSQLQYQMNPHFLYNAYFSLRALLEEDEYDRATKFAELLGGYLKYVTAASGATLVRLSEEIAHAWNYAQIQQIRFSKRVEVEFQSCPERFLSWRVPPLILQPLIENAFQHGIKQRLNDAIIMISFREGDSLYIDVEDNGQSLTDEVLAALREKLASSKQAPAQESVALINIHRRLQILFGDDSGLALSRSSLGGMRATLHIAGRQPKPTYIGNAQ